jgi:hypothetical protein
VGGGNIRGYMISEEKGERLRRAQATITGTCNKTPAFAGLSYGVESRDYRGRRDGKVLDSFLSSFVPFLSLFSWASGFVGGDEIHRLWVFVAPNPWSLDLCDTRDASCSRVGSCGLCVVLANQRGEVMGCSQSRCMR